jgi:hypothetical protein
MTRSPTVADLAGAFRDASPIVKWGLGLFCLALIALGFLIQAGDLLHSLGLLLGVGLSKG